MKKYICKKINFVILMGAAFGMMNLTSGPEGHHFNPLSRVGFDKEGYSKAIATDPRTVDQPIEVVGLGDVNVEMHEGGFSNLFPELSFDTLIRESNPKKLNFSKIFSLGGNKIENSLDSNGNLSVKHPNLDLKPNLSIWKPTEAQISGSEEIPAMNSVFEKNENFLKQVKHFGKIRNIIDRLSKRDMKIISDNNIKIINNNFILTLNHRYDQNKSQKELALGQVDFYNLLQKAVQHAKSEGIDNFRINQLTHIEETIQDANLYAEISKLEFNGEQHYQINFEYV